MVNQYFLKMLSTSAWTRDLLMLSFRAALWAKALWACISDSSRDFARALVILSALISASTLDRRKIYSLANLSAYNSVSILDLLNALSLAALSAAIWVSTLDLLRLASKAAWSAASLLDLLSASSATTSAYILDLLNRVSAIYASTRDLLRAASTSRSRTRREYPYDMTNKNNIRANHL